MKWLRPILVGLLAWVGLVAHAQEFRVAVADYRYSGVWQSVVQAIQQADPDNRYTLVGVYPQRRLVAEGLAGHFDFFFPSGKKNDGGSLLGFEQVSSVELYRTDLVLLSRRDVPALDDQGKSRGEIEAMAGVAHLLSFSVTQTNQLDLGVKKLLAGRVVGVVGGRPSLTATVHDLGADDKVQWQSLVSGAVCAGYVPSTGWQERAKHVDGILEKLRQDGTLARLLAPITGN